ncbi:amino acid adenylation domain-containing protein [Plectonema cf. radiosum LEGE 06105]|uniref:Amino acid adenylation domain-containing protein n=1 Tax=Plectonema cf. radiosum LEGE 06105 TaxID=945769 RepID=A0A8J7FEM9_9CYAN|nr:non-ribosomal peptide synthetase [Plectonema radiosum]MBE9212891.1 amino acid adenylation domain-containing protein [Plectonema cf. radiosum LEGE 06105]
MDKQKNIENIYPLSPMQQGILFHSLLSPDAGAYVPQVCITVDGLTDVIAFQKSWNEVFQRHSILRTAFRWEKRDQSFQVVYRVLDLPWQQQDWREFSPEEQQHKLEDFLEEDRQQGFDLKIPPLLRITLIHLTESCYHLIWTQHHLIIDGWSAGLVLKEVFQLYQVFHKGADLPDLLIYNYRPYADYITWLGEQDLSTAEKFWKTQLEGFSTPNVLQVKQSSSNSIKPNWTEQQISLPASITNNLKTLAKNHQFTLNTLIQGAFAILLSRYSNQDDIVFGATSSGRPPTLTGSESMVGLFINTLPVRVQVDPEASLIPWLQQLQTQQIEALQYEYTPLLEIQNWSEIPRGSMLFEHILVFENYPVDASLLRSQDGLKIEKVNSLEWTSFPLTMLVSVASELTFKIKYDSNRFDDSRISGLFVSFYTLLEAIANNPFSSLIKLPVLTDAQQQLLTEWNLTQSEYPQQCIHELFEAQVELTPNATAVIFKDDLLTYQELNTKANQLAHYLQTLGVQSEVLVGISLERSVEMVIAILAILKAGGAYVPLDPEYPQERLDFIKQETQVKTVLTQDKITEILSDAAQLLQSNPVNNTIPENSIYVIYTSGSTGKPKGVINTHRGLVNRLYWMQQTYQLTADDRVLQKTPFSFDVSVWEFFWTLLFGATLIIAEPGGHKDSGYLVNLIKEQQITTLHFVPSMLEAFLEEPQLEFCTSLKRVICSGEALTSELQKRFFTHLNAQLHNLYGPTEAAIDVTYYEGRRQEAEGRRKEEKGIKNTSPHPFTIPIGTPIHNTQIYILDSHLRQVPIGVAGELYIGGDGLARGYLKRPDLTAQSFIPNPFNETSPPSPLLTKERGAEGGVRLSSKLYKTGDKARYLPDGNIEFLGRIDYQVKIRGFRIELGEIEVVLLQHPEVKTAVVIAKEYQSQNQNNNSRLVAYVVPIQEETETAELKTSLRSFLEAKLPSYMIPSAFVILESIPLTPNGKIDRRSLLALDEMGVKLFHQVLPRNSTEEMIAIIWKEVLKLEQVGIYDNFFDLGGNSLLATRINSRLRQTFELDLPLRSIFEKPTIVAIAVYIQALQITIQQQNSNTPTTGRKEIEL